jgi:putative membrane protein (TIGR04086 family)
MQESTNNLSSNNLFRIFKGSIISILFTLILLFIFSIILTYSSVSETVIPPVIIVISAISILIGSSISTMKIRKNGLVNGLIVGLIYMLFIYIISSILNTGFSLNTNSIIMIISGIAAGIIGGIVGVNLNQNH